MTANELRIGNWLNFYGSPSVVRGGFLMLLDEGRTKELPPHEPIPLTPEILEKCGFKGDLAEVFGEFRTSRDVPNGKQIYFIRRFQGNITYLHQLQNIYFSLTGEELDVQL